MIDDVLGLRTVKQPIRALLYEKLVWKHLFGFRVNQHHRAAEAKIRTFTYHENGSLRTILGVIGFLVIVEGVAIDFFVATKSIKVAIVLAALHCIMFLYCVALITASRQRPILVTSDGLLVRTSLLYCCWIPIDSLRNVRGLDKDIVRVSSPDVLWCALGDSPNILIELSQPEDAILPFGIIHRPTRLYVYVDKPAEMLNSIGSLDANLSPNV